MKTYTKDDVSRWAEEQTLELEGGLSAVIECRRDNDMGPPWEEHDGHGEVSDWRRRGDGHYPKVPGERLLHEDYRGRSARFYDWKASMKTARRDGWGLCAEEKAKLAEKHGKPVEKLTRGEICAEAVERDFKYLRAWCRDDWEWVYIIVTLKDENGEEIERDSLGGVESAGEYWREVAAEMLNTLLTSYAVEQDERTAWEERDVMTEGAKP